MLVRTAATWLACVSLMSTPLLAAAAPAVAVSTVSDDGSVRIDGLWVPPSQYMSPEARDRYISLVRHADPAFGADIAAARAFYDQFNRRQLDKARVRYPVTITHREMGGVPVDVVTPAGGVRKSAAKAVLINLHGGAFLWGAGAGGQLEAVPIASTLGVEVVTVDYREGPEHKFPAASEDVASVYRELLKTHAAKNIGIYGCSAGGLLTAESVAWFQKHALPRPAAIGIFCAGGGDFSGDSSYSAVALMGKPPVAEGSAGLRTVDLPYFQGVDLQDPLAFPVQLPSVLKAFPPTLIISGTRDFAMSAAINLQRRLTAVGVDAQLQLWDGMWHAFFMDSDLPESREAYAVIARFFGDHLGLPMPSDR